MDLTPFLNEIGTSNKMQTNELEVEFFQLVVFYTKLHSYHILWLIVNKKSYYCPYAC